MIVERLKAIRHRLGYSQKDMIQKLKISKSTYSRWETGEKIIPLKHLIHLCNILNISIDYFLGIEENKIPLESPLQLDAKRIGKNILEIRKKAQLSQQELAESLHTTQSTISSYENGKTIILTAFLYDICTKFKISAQNILN